MASGIGARIRMSRLLAGLALQDVADRVGVSKMAISNYENNKMTPGSATLIKLARALNQPIEFLLRGPAEVDIQPVYRRKVSVRGKHEEKIKMQLIEWLERYLAAEAMYPLDEQLIYQSPPGFPRVVSSADDIEAAADALRLAWNLGEDAIENLTETLEDHGIKVGFVDGIDGFDGCLFSLKDGSPVIAAKRGLPPDRLRFNLAHELGHLMIRPKVDMDEEKAAHRFASAFLVPSRKARFELGSVRRSIGSAELTSLKAKYGMSMSAWVHRAADLGILSESSAKSLYIQFSQNGWKKREPEAGLSSESPQRLYRLVARAVSEGAISKARATELLGKDQVEAIDQQPHHQQRSEKHAPPIAALGC